MTGGGMTLEMARVLPGPRPLVFEFLTDPRRLATWWGPTGFSIPSLEFDARVGATYRIEMQPPEGEAFHLTGEFCDVDPPARLAYTFRWEDPDPDDVEIVAGLSLRDLGESTEVVLTQGPFKTEARRELHRGGSTDSFDKLEAALATPDAGH
jgi:uncharacterized protein YndB with AHSA1/START domain